MFGTQLTLIEQLKEQLNQLMASPVNTIYEVSDSIPIQKDLVMGDILLLAEKNNPALLIAKQNITIAGLTLKERKAERFPTVSLNSAYNFNRTNNKTVLNTFTPLFNRNLGFNYGITATITILNGYNTKRLIKQAQLDIDYNKIIYENTKAKNEIAISTAFKSYELQKNMLQLEEENISMSRELLTVAQERYRVGVSNSLELRDAQRTFEESISRLTGFE